MLTDNLFDVPKRRELRELNIVPILDMLVTIIFFLLLSTSFLQYNKLTIPPSRTSVISSPELPPPLQTRLLLTKISANEMKLILYWAGVKPGAFVEKVSYKNPEDLRLQISTKLKGFLVPYKKENSKEKTIQIGLGPEIQTSLLIFLMDSVRDFLPDIVLLSFLDTQVSSDKFADKGSQ